MSPFVPSAPTLRRSGLAASALLGMALLASACSPRDPASGNAPSRDPAAVAPAIAMPAPAPAEPASIPGAATTPSTAATVPAAGQVFPTYRTDSAAPAVGSAASGAAQSMPMAASAPMDAASSVRP